MLSFSTCWNNSRHHDGEAMIDEIIDLGFTNIELSHGMTVAKLPGIRKAYAAGKFTCSGVHNYFPSPVEVMIDAPDAYEFTSHRPFDRQRAMERFVRLEASRTLPGSGLGLSLASAVAVLHGGALRLDDAQPGVRATLAMPGRDVEQAGA